PGIDGPGLTRRPLRAVRRLRGRHLDGPDATHAPAESPRAGVGPGRLGRRPRVAGDRHGHLTGPRPRPCARPLEAPLAHRAGAPPLVALRPAPSARRGGAPGAHFALQRLVTYRPGGPRSAGLVRTRASVVGRRGPARRVVSLVRWRTGRVPAGPAV